MKIFAFIVRGIVGGPLALFAGVLCLFALPVILIFLAGNALFDGELVGRVERD